MKSRFILFILSVIVWVLITGALDVPHLAVGVAASLLVALLAGDLFVSRPYVFRHAERYFWFLYYVPMFIWECFKANIDVVMRVIHPACPIKPGIVKVKTTLKSDTALTFLANSITLTPGTLTVDIDKGGGYLYVHWIYVHQRDVEGATKQIVERFEKILQKIFD